MIGFATSILHSINPSKNREREREHHEPVSQFFASKLYVQNNSIESNWIRSSPSIIWYWYELHFPAGCRDCTCVVSRATLTSSCSTSGETGGSRWVSWSPNIYWVWKPEWTFGSYWHILTMYENRWHFWYLLVLLVEYWNWFRGAPYQRISVPFVWSSSKWRNGSDCTKDLHQANEGRTGGGGWDVGVGDVTWIRTWDFTW